MVPAPRYPTAIGTGADGKGTADTAKPDEGLAPKAIDNLADGTGRNEDRASRKRGLPKGPEEFRGVRRSAKGKKMTKAPGEIEPPKQISKAEREARRAFRQVDAATAMSEYEIAQAAFLKNRERLKAERLAREATATPPTKAKSRAKKK